MNRLSEFLYFLHQRDIKRDDSHSHAMPHTTQRDCIGPSWDQCHTTTHRYSHSAACQRSWRPSALNRTDAKRYQKS